MPITFWIVLLVLEVFAIAGLIRATILKNRAQREHTELLLNTLKEGMRIIELYEAAMVWAVGTGKLPPTCPGQFMGLMLAAKRQADAMNGVPSGENKLA